MLNLLNGNYDPNIYYDDLRNDSSITWNAASEIADQIHYYSQRNNYAAYEEYFFGDRPYYKDLYEFIFDNYIMTDPEYALGVFANKRWDSWATEITPGFGYIARMAICHAIAEEVYERSDFENLVKEGMTNKRIAELYANNYASLKNDGYLTYDDSMILFATSGRMTVLPRRAE